VQQVLQMIEDRQLSKLVLARSAELVTPRPVCVADALAKLRQRYPSCYIFALHNGSGNGSSNSPGNTSGNACGQTFLGASPERLLSLQGEHLVVDALAGSTRRGQTLTEDFALAQGLLASEKDRREHQLIVEYILQTLAQLGITPQAPVPPMLLQLPNIQHLQTLITAHVPAALSLLSILQHLHPTPAVAGVPRRLACEQIRQLEPFERHLYAAPLGWIDAQGNGEFIVGLRSALIESNRVRLYAGAGIVAGSDPEREFQEIQLKLRALSETLFAGA
jgi:menaquinone-specific isochorismate synthase